MFWRFSSSLQSSVLVTKGGSRRWPYFLTSFIQYVSGQIYIDKNRPELKAFELWILRSNARSPIFINLKINLIFSLYPGKCNSISVDCWFRIQKANQKSRNFEALYTRGLSYPQVTIPWKQGWAPPIAHMGSSGSAGSDLVSLSVSSTRFLSSVRFLCFN